MSSFTKRILVLLFLEMVIFMHMTDKNPLYSQSSKSEEISL